MENKQDLKIGLLKLMNQKERKVINDDNDDDDYNNNA